MASHPKPNFDERQWVKNIQQALKEELETDIEIPVCIFNVPKALMSIDPHSYTPQEVAIGRYHHWRSELYAMERHKLGAAKRAQRQLQGDHDFEYVVDQLKELELPIRTSYHKRLNLSNDALSWMMAIDASFLLEFLQIYAMKEGTFSGNSPSRSMSHLINDAGTKAVHNAIPGDMVMFENQIPLLVLRKILEIQYSSLETADDMLEDSLQAVCEELSPFKMTKKKPIIRLSECAHLLDFLYDTIVLKDEQLQSEITEIEDQGGATQKNEIDFVDITYAKKFFHDLWKLLSKNKQGLVQLIKKLLLSIPFLVSFKLPWRVLSKLPGFSILAQPIQTLVFPTDNQEKKTVEESNGTNKTPSVEEITIPSVTELSKANVHFSAVVGNVSTVSFDTKTAKLYLPKVRLDVTQR